MVSLERKYAEEPSRALPNPNRVSKGFSSLLIRSDAPNQRFLNTRRKGIDPNSWTSIKKSAKEFQLLSDSDGDVTWFVGSCELVNLASLVFPVTGIKLRPEWSF